MLKRIIAKQLGELLIELGVIQQIHLDKALAVQKQKGGLIGEILVDLGFAKEEDIAQSITVQYGFPYLPLANYDITPEIVNIIPQKTARFYMLIPIDKMGNNLTIAMSNPLNTKAVEEIEQISRCNVQIFVATSSDIRDAINKYYKI
jgi:type IV pilus assembly protein PilB